MNKDSIYKELYFKAVRSSGAGGQHVNKVSSKVELYFDLSSSEGFTEKEKQLLLKNLSNRINKEGDTEKYILAKVEANIPIKKK